MIKIEKQISVNYAGLYVLTKHARLDDWNYGTNETTDQDATA